MLFLLWALSLSRQAEVREEQRKKKMTEPETPAGRHSLTSLCARELFQREFLIFFSITLQGLDISM